MKNEDYLWDRTGDPDPDVQQLEEILGTLRYQPRPLEIPAAPNRFSKLYRGFAIAAAIALVAMGLSLWLGIQRRQTPDVTRTDKSSTNSEQRAAAAPVEEKKVNGLLASNSEPTSIEDGSTIKPRNVRANPNPRHITRRVTAKTATMPASEIAEGQAAKSQLMLALRVASSKLGLAQRKSQGNLVNNQHKIG